MFAQMVLEENPTGDRIADDAIKTAKLFGTLSAASDSEVTRAPGLILTKEQIINLKHYEIEALALPIRIEDVITYLGYSEAMATGLEPDDFLKSFSLIHKHAQRWDPLRNDLLAIGSKLKVFAGQMLVYGKGMDEINDDIKSARIVEAHDIKTLEDVKRLHLELGDTFPGIELDDEDKTTARDIQAYLAEILAIVRRNLEDTQTIKVALDQFGLDLSTHVKPEIQRKVAAIESNSLPADVARLSAAIEQRSKDIDEKNAEYKASVEQSLSSLGKFNVVGLALSIYFGVEAEGVRNARNELQGQQARDIEALQHKDAVLGLLNKVKFKLQNLVTIVIDADVATKNLITVWNTLFLYIESSAQHSSDISDALTLRTFMLRFRQVVKPWEAIEHDANALLNVFKEADEEYKRIYGDL